MEKYKKVASILALMPVVEKKLTETRLEHMTDKDLIELESAIEKFLGKKTEGFQKEEKEMVSVPVKELRKIRSTAGGIQAMLSSGDINTNTVINSANEIISRVDHLTR